MPLEREDYPGGGRALRGVVGAGAGGAFDTGWVDIEGFPNGAVTIEGATETDVGSGTVRVHVSNLASCPDAGYRGAILNAAIEQDVVSWVGLSYRWLRVLSNASPPDQPVNVVFYGWEVQA